MLTSIRKLYDWVLCWAETPYGTIALFILAFFFMGCVLFVDFVDGPLCSISNYKTKIGDELDNLCPEICSFSGLIIIGYISNSQIYFIISIMTSVMINSFVLKTGESIPLNFKCLKVTLKNLLL